MKYLVLLSELRNTKVKEIFAPKKTFFNNGEGGWILCLKILIFIQVT